MVGQSYEQCAELELPDIEKYMMIKNALTHKDADEHDDRKRAEGHTQ